MANRRIKRISKKCRLKQHRSKKQKIKKAYNVHISKKHIKNFSNVSLTDNEILALGKGLKFIPSPPIKGIKCNLLKDFKSLCRKMRCRYELDDGSNTSLHPFYTHSDYQPPMANNAIENYIFQTMYELDNMKLHRNYSNLNKGEWQAIRSLQKRIDITIKKADKSNSIVILDTKRYINNGIEQLSDIHYAKIPNATTEDIGTQTKDIVSVLNETKSIDKTTFKYLNDPPLNNKCGTLYLLPKIHKVSPEIIDNLENIWDKTTLSIPSRPIISQCGTPTAKLSRLLDYFLLPMVQKQNTYIKDTTHFIQKLESLICDDSTILCTYDVTSMYTNMSIHELISAVDRCLNNINQMDYKIPIISKEYLLTICKLILENNQFEFAGEYYVQKIGCAMGAVPSPEICDIRAYEVIESILNKFHLKDNILFHCRFRDDGFILFNHCQIEDVHRLFSIANKEHELLKFTFEISKECVNYLDTTVYKGNKFKNTKILDIKSYIKKTETFQYLHRTSAHPPNVFKGLIKGETLRHLRNNSSKQNLNNVLQLYKFNLKNRGYSLKEIQNAMKDALNKTREEVIYKTKDANNSKAIPLTLVTKYHPSLKALSHNLKKHWSLIENDETAKNLFPRPPVIAYKRSRNIGEFIISAKVKNIPPTY